MTKQDKFNLLRAGVTFKLASSAKVRFIKDEPAVASTTYHASIEQGPVKLEVSGPHPYGAIERLAVEINSWLNNSRHQ